MESNGQPKKQEREAYVSTKALRLINNHILFREKQMVGIEKLLDDIIKGNVIREMVIVDPYIRSFMQQRSLYQLLKEVANQINQPENVPKFTLVTMESELKEIKESDFHPGKKVIPVSDIYKTIFTEAFSYAQKPVTPNMFDVVSLQKSFMHDRSIIFLAEQNGQFRVLQAKLGKGLDVGYCNCCNCKDKNTPVKHDFKGRIATARIARTAGNSSSVVNCQGGNNVPANLGITVTKIPHTRLAEIDENNVVYYGGTEITLVEWQVSDNARANKLFKALKEHYVRNNYKKLNSTICEMETNNQES